MKKAGTGSGHPHPPAPLSKRAKGEAARMPCRRSTWLAALRRSSRSTKTATPRTWTFQALESAVGFCLHGCVECVVVREQNIHRILTAKETVNKLLLDFLGPLRGFGSGATHPMRAMRYGGFPRQAMLRGLCRDAVRLSMLAEMRRTLPPSRSITCSKPDGAGWHCT